MSKTFIRAVEYWVPGRDRTLLEFGGGLYARAPKFGAISRQMVFGRGEGLPGHAWEAGHPLVLKDLQDPMFRRAKAAKAEGLTCGIAVPIYAGDFLTSVLVLFCGDDAEHAGAIEVWHHDPAKGKEMTLADGCYGTTGDAFELATPIARRVEVWQPDAARQTLLRTGGFCEARGVLPALAEGGVERGQGTIGAAFATGAPAVSEAAASEQGAVGAGAADAGVDSLVALPVLRGGRLVAVAAWYL